VNKHRIYDDREYVAYSGDRMIDFLLRMMSREIGMIVVSGGPRDVSKLLERVRNDPGGPNGSMQTEDEFDCKNARTYE